MPPTQPPLGQKGAAAVAAAADQAVRDAVEAPRSLPGLVAGVTDRHGTAYLGAAGVRSLASGMPMTPDTVLAAFSTTKPITGTVALQLVEEGRLDLDAPAKRYAPALAEIGVLDGFDASGRPVVRPPRRDVTARHLLVHTAGFAYEMFNESYQRLVTEHGQVSTATATHRSLMTPLLFDPGERWEYGSSIDWLGQVVEGVTGQRLGDVMRERVFEPLGMTDTAFTLTDEQRARRAGMHRRMPDGSVVASRISDREPEVHMGGQGLYTTVPDYLAFMRMWLDDGATASGQQLLRPDTVARASRNQLGGLAVHALPAVVPAVTNRFELFPGMPTSWAHTFMVNDEDAPTGLPAGSLQWTGLANLYFWIDMSTRVAGYWAVQLLPFADPTAMGAFLDFQAAVYTALSA
jgi:methyl acetate hydrolase